MLKLRYFCDIQVDYSELVVVRSRDKNVRMISITTAILKITVTKWALKTFQFSSPMSTYSQVTDKPYLFFNNKMGPARKLVMTIFPSLPNSANSCLPTREIVYLCEINSYRSPIFKKVGGAAPGWLSQLSIRLQLRS